MFGEEVCGGILSSFFNTSSILLIEISGYEFLLSSYVFSTCIFLYSISDCGLRRNDHLTMNDKAERIVASTRVAEKRSRRYQV